MQSTADPLWNGYQFLGMLKVLSKCGLVSSHDEVLGKVSYSIKSGDFESKGREIAGELYGKIILLYT